MTNEQKLRLKNFMQRYANEVRIGMKLSLDDIIKSHEYEMTKQSELKRTMDEASEAWKRYKKKVEYEEALDYASK